MRFEVSKIALKHNRNKYHIFDKYKKCTYEVFYTQKDLFRLVSSFHVPFVRMYYDFEEIYCCMSYLFATRISQGIANNLCWFANNSKAIDIIYKYFKRGFGFSLNNEDIKTFSKYLYNKGEEYQVIDILNTD